MVVAKLRDKQKDPTLQGQLNRKKTLSYRGVAVQLSLIDLPKKIRTSINLEEIRMCDQKFLITHSSSNIMKMINNLTSGK